MSYPRVVIFVPVDPRQVIDAWSSIEPQTAQVEIVAYVVPYEQVKITDEKHLNGVPVYGWEDPGSNKERARQYLELYKLVKAEYVISLGWQQTIFYGPGDSAYMMAIDPRAFLGGPGDMLSRIIRIKLGILRSSQEFL